MKRVLLLILLLTSIIIVNAQPGMVGHWTFDGNANDVSGNGLNGIMNNVVPDTGYYGQPNTALRFNGINSNIIIPYGHALNVKKFSIVALLQVRGFYSNTCQAEVIFNRSTESSTGHYGLLMFDNALDGNDCFAFDSSKFTFAGLGPSVSPTVWQYSPTIVSHKWYRVALTFDSVNYKLYVNGVLKVSAQTQYGPIDSSYDAAVIGSNYDNLVNYPYWFNGLIDDIKLFNRALTTAEVLQLEGVDDIIPNYSVSLSPNPVSDILNITLPQTTTSATTLTLTDAMGRLINTYSLPAGTDKTSINTTGLSSGIYFLHVLSGTSSQVLKVMKE
jgi:hypothetical protein